MLATFTRFVLNSMDQIVTNKLVPKMGGAITWGQCKLVIDKRYLYEHFVENLINHEKMVS